MPSKYVDMTTSPSNFAAEKKNAKIIPTSLMVDNVLGAQDAVLTLVDQFTTSDTHGQNPTPQHPTRLAINVSRGANVSLDEGELKGIEFLGAPEVAVVDEDANCKVTMGYKFQ